MKATRHNGRSGKNGTYNPRHNDRRFDLENSEHIDAGRVRKNIYWTVTVAIPQCRAGKKILRISVLRRLNVLFIRNIMECI